jgi:ribosomal-protein-alanine N-acetyltransferase
MSAQTGFETKRLYLLPTSEADAGLIFQLMNTPKWLKYIGDRKIRSEADALHYIRNKIQREFEQNGYSNFTMIRKADRAKVGSCGLFNRDGMEGVDVGYALLPEYEGHGYAFEGASRMLEAARHVFQIKTVRAVTAKDNLGSQKILRKLGMQFVSNITLPDEDEEIMMFEVSW